MTLTELVNCPDCNLSMTVHTLKHDHKKEDIVKDPFKKKKQRKYERAKL